MGSAELARHWAARLLLFLSLIVFWVSLPLGGWLVEQSKRIDPHWEHWATTAYACWHTHTTCVCGGTVCPGREPWPNRS